MSKKRTVIDLTLSDSDDDADDAKKPAASSSSKKPKATSRSSTVKREGKPAAAAAKATPALEDDGLEVVDQSDQPLVPVARMPTPSTSANDDDVEVVGAKNEVRLPHMRQHCTQFKFDPTPSTVQQQYQQSTLDTNSKSCDLCYCYVCDCPVKECKSWCSDSSTFRSANHCCASDSVAFWTSRRSMNKATGTTSHVAGPDGYHSEDSDSSDSSEDSDSQDSYGYGFDPMLGMLMGFNVGFSRGPSILSPGSKLTARQKQDMVQCRKCKYITRPREDRYCLKCGRVASEQIFDLCKMSGS